jgi:hypothetical protein
MVLRLLAHQQRKASFACMPFWTPGVELFLLSTSVGFIRGGQVNTDVQKAHLCASIAIVLLHSGQLLVTAGGSL